MRKDGWTAGTWRPDGHPFIDPIEDAAIAGVEIEYVWLYINTERSRPHCTTVRNADFHLRTHRHAAEQSGKLEGIRWWWKLADPTPPAPRVPKAKKRMDIVTRIGELDDGK